MDCNAIVLAEPSPADRVVRAEIEYAGSDDLFDYLKEKIIRMLMLRFPNLQFQVLNNLKNIILTVRKKNISM